MAKPGRRPLDQSSRVPSAAVHLKLSARDYDRADRMARQSRQTIQDVIRSGLKRLLSDERGGRL